MGSQWNWIQPLWIVAVGAIGAAFGLWGVAKLLELLSPTTAAVARTTAKESRSQPLFPAVI